jgi:hypothetical protein
MILVPVTNDEGQNADPMIRWQAEVEPARNGNAGGGRSNGPFEIMDLIFCPFSAGGEDLGEGAGGGDGPGHGLGDADDFFRPFVA